jgi:hypothetical protein
MATLFVQNVSIMHAVSSVFFQWIAPLESPRYYRSL